VKTITNKQDVIAALKDPEFQKLCTITSPGRFESYFEHKHGVSFRHHNISEYHGILDYSDDLADDGDPIGYIALGIKLAETKFDSGYIIVSRHFADKESPFRVSYYQGVAAITEYRDDEIIDETLGYFTTIADALIGAHMVHENPDIYYDLEESVEDAKKLQRSQGNDLSLA